MTDIQNNYHTPVLSRRYVVGYSGYIPGLMFRYGQTFGAAAEDSISSYLNQVADRRERERAEVRRSKSLPRLRPKRTESQVVQEFYSKYGIDGRSSSRYPPLPGYTGYIPRMKPTDLGIGRTFSNAARKGLSNVTMTRDERDVESAQRYYDPSTTNLARTPITPGPRDTPAGNPPYGFSRSVSESITPGPRDTPVENPPSGFSRSVSESASPFPRDTPAGRPPSGFSRSVSESISPYPQ